MQATCYYTYVILSIILSSFVMCYLNLVLLLLCRYYISKGAVVDQLGGDLNSTPLHWAIRYAACYY